MTEKTVPVKLFDKVVGSAVVKGDSAVEMNLKFTSEILAAAFLNTNEESDPELSVRFDLQKGAFTLKNVGR